MAGTTTGTTIPGSMSPSNDIGSLLGNLANIFLGKTTTQTQQTHLTPEAMNRLIQQMMEGTSGLAATAGGQKGAGLYNSSTNQLLINDLLTRVSGEAALKGAPTTNTSTIQPQINPLMALAGLGLMQTAGAGWDGVFGGKKGKAPTEAGSSSTGGGAMGGGVTAEGGPGFFSNPLGSIADTISSPFSSMANALGFGGGPEFSGANTAASNYFSTAAKGVNLDPALGAVDYSGAGMGGLSGVNLGGSEIGIPGLDTLDYSFAPVGNIQNVLGKSDLSGFDFGGESGINAGAGFMDSIPWTAGLGSLAQGDLGGAIGSVGKSYVTGMMGNALTPVLGPLGPILGAIGGALSVICTELRDQKLINLSVYLAEHLYAAKYVSPTTYVGYRLWADPVVRLMRKSKLTTRVVAWFAIPYIYDCAAQVNCPDAPRRNVKGRIVGYIGTPICYLLGLGVKLFGGIRYGY